MYHTISSFSVKTVKMLFFLPVIWQNTFNELKHRKKVWWVNMTKPRIPDPDTYSGWLFSVTDVRSDYLRYRSGRKFCLYVCVCIYIYPRIHPSIHPSTHLHSDTHSPSTIHLTTLTHTPNPPTHIPNPPIHPFNHSSISIFYQKSRRLVRTIIYVLMNRRTLLSLNYYG